jgi:predicted protein tyrosine phosphatase
LTRIQHIFWIAPPAGAAPYPGRLAIMPRPRGGEWLAGEIAQWHGASIRSVLGLLQPAEIDELDLRAEAALCQGAGIEFRSFPITDMSVPASRAEARAAARAVAERLLSGTSVAIHCRGGIGRSSLMAACTFVRLGVAPDAAFTAISAARGLAVPETEEQRRWVADFASLAASEG